MSVVWRPVETNPNYSVSSDGRVRRHPWRELRQYENAAGYLYVCLSGPRLSCRVHRLVAAAFIPNPNNYPCVNHIDHDRQNNDVGNLEWCTQAMNLAHARAAGRLPQNELKMQNIAAFHALVDAGISRTYASDLASGRRLVRQETAERIFQKSGVHVGILQAAQ